MNPFRTNKADRKKFADVLGLDPITFFYSDCTPVFSYSDSGKTEFIRKGFQWTVAKLAEDHIYYYPVGPYTELTSNHLPNARGYGKSLGEQLFRAVVALHDELEKSNGE